jgi:hypothetical protein
MHAVSEARANPWIASWAVLGVVALFGRAMVRLGALALAPILEARLSALQALLYASWVAISVYFEGYRGFQLRFCPRVVARAMHLAQHPRPLFIAFAPLFAMGFFHANRKTLALAWGTTAMVALFIVGFRHVAQPWRGIVDGGVVVALAYGAVTLVIMLGRALSAGAVAASPELPARPTDPH